MVSRSSTDIGKLAVHFGQPRVEPRIMLLKGCLGRRARRRAPGQRWNVLVRWSFPCVWFAGWRSMANSIFELLDTQAFLDGREFTWIGITGQFWWVRLIQIEDPFGVILMTFRRYPVSLSARRRWLSDTASSTPRHRNKISKHGNNKRQLAGRGKPLCMK